jgi:ubiquitin-conjugating enzyme E2 variant
MDPATIATGDETAGAAPSMLSRVGGARSCFAAAIVIAGGLALRNGAGIAAATNPSNAMQVALALVSGVLAADLLTGLIHWACDTWGDERSRRPGAQLIRDFREHHRRPQAMLAHDWVEVNGEAAAAAAVPLAVMALGGVHVALLEHPAGYAFAGSAIVVSALSNQIHQWAHMHAPPRFAHRLQRAGLILSRRRHALHHRAPCVVRYCITTGWMNPALDAIGFWRALEARISRLTGVRPRAHDARVVPAEEVTRLAPHPIEEEA